MTDDGAIRAARMATIDAVRDMLHTRDPTPLAPVLAADARWYGTGPGGGCRTREDVVQTLRRALAHMRFELYDARLRGDQAVVHLVLPGGEPIEDEAFFVLTLDERGLVTELLEYTSSAGVEHDLAIRAAGPAAFADAGPAPAVSALVPFVYVADMERSLAFYRQLGFTPRETHPLGGEPLWTFLQSEDASLMLACSDAPIAHPEQANFFYLYAHDLGGLRDRLVANGLAPGEIYCGAPGPREEMRVADPDGYVLMIAQIDAAT
jgi:catechol 2,3-dioxygenase-like lactoylglutathione lyase family enzyme